MRSVPDAAAGPGGGIGAADGGGAGRGRATSRAAGAITREGATLDAMGLGRGVWAGSDGCLRTLYDIYPALAAATGTSGIRRVQPAKPADFSRGLLERMAIRDHTPRGAGDDDPGWIWDGVLPEADPPGFGAGAGLRRILRGAGDAGARLVDRVPERGQRYSCERRNDQGRHVHHRNQGADRWHR